MNEGIALKKLTVKIDLLQKKEAYFTISLNFLKI